MADLLAECWVDLSAVMLAFLKVDSMVAQMADRMDGLLVDSWAAC